MASVLVVDDEKKITLLLEGELSDVGHDVQVANDGDEAIRLVRAKPYDVVVTDLRLGATDGLAVLRAAKEADPDVVVLMMTAYATVSSAVAAMKEGAADYLEKPVNFEKLALVMDRGLERRRLSDENRRLRERVGSGDVGAAGMVRGRSEAMKRVMALVEKVAPSEASVLLRGESGTGKEVVARALHEMSARADRSLVAVNCAALSETLLESELFGHEKGAFTDATARKLGWFEVANGGTILLDEIGEMNASTQAKLLRVLEDHRFHRLGGSEIIQADVRVVAATNRNLEAAIRDGHFREDLFYRLNVFPIDLPPLRERMEDLGELVAHFFERCDYRGPGLDPKARASLEGYDWPGNLRELRNVVERAVILAGSGPVTLAEIHIPERRRAEPGAAPDETTLSQTEERMIREALERAGGNKSKAARLLGITRRALYGRLEKYGMDASED
ncbi:MAG: sigma-54-dependent Fis family transcriptional regulator [Gemmatimonadota bacterium]|nr:MAG: sigma-54-dependent Fis family transcriptional regulator [Gemmatimonadota bacterium]